MEYRIMAGGSESEEAAQVDRCFWRGRWGGTGKVRTVKQHLGQLWLFYTCGWLVSR